MVPDPTKNHPDPGALQRGYEADDVNARAVGVLLGGFAVLFAAILGGLWVFTRLTRSASEVPAVRSVVTQTTVGRDAPPLQPQIGHESLDAWDLAKMRDQEAATFKALGWTMNERTHRFDVPAAVVGALQARQAKTQATTQPATQNATAPAVGSPTRGGR